MKTRKITTERIKDLPISNYKEVDMSNEAGMSNEAPVIVEKNIDFFLLLFCFRSIRMFSPDSVRIRSFSVPHFSAFGLNREIYEIKN